MTPAAERKAHHFLPQNNHSSNGCPVIEVFYDDLPAGKLQLLRGIDPRIPSPPWCLAGVTMGNPAIDLQ